MATTEVVGELYAKYLDANEMETAYRAQWREQTAAAGRSFSDEKRNHLAAGLVSLKHARRFCAWLSERGATADPVRTYRLPTEDEWE